MNKSQFFGAALAVFAVVVAGIGVFLFFFGGKPNDLPSPAKLYQDILTGTPEQQELAALELARFSAAKDSRAPEAKDMLRKALREPGLRPEVRGAILNGIGDLKDWECIPEVLDCLNDTEVYVRRSAGAAITKILGVNYYFNASASPEERKFVGDQLREIGNSWYKMQKKDQANKK